MKLSLAWIFDHIGADYKKQDIKKLAAKFNQVTAEIEDYFPISFKLDSFALGKVQSIDGDQAIISILEMKKQIVLSLRKDIENLSPEALENMSFLIKMDKEPVWAEVKDFGLRKEGLMPSFFVEGNLLSGGWRSQVESDDIILEVDNKSLTHRPDMWGHRGFAREIAAFLDLPFLPKEEFLIECSEEYFEKASKPSQTNPFIIDNKAPKACRRFSGLYFKSIDNAPSDLAMAMRLLKVGVRPINALVDLTNYVMLDWSQPLHAFDSEKVEDKKIIIRMAKKGEKLALLDGAELELTDQDLVIADGKKAMALAGVMGGLDDSVTEKTTSIFLESANFDASSIRRSALRHKVRTESSARFEKTLDPNQITDAIRRLLALAKKININFDVAEEIFVVGPALEEEIVEVSHKYLEDRSGVKLTEKDVVEPLTKIGFFVSKEDDIYTVVVPSFRCAKDVKHKEDILEEVIRFYGFNKIELELPRLLKRPLVKQPIYRIRKIKSCLVDAASMTEQQNYAFFDEGFLAEIGYEPKDETVNVLNPISENYKRLVTSLIPGLLKNVKDNFMVEDRLFFFELGRIWEVNKGEPSEYKRLSVVFFHKRGDVDFYECKSFITQLFDDLSLKADWKKLEEVEQLWQNPFQTAEIISGGRRIGTAGKVDKSFLAKLDVLPESDAFIFDIDANYLIDADPEVQKYHPISKYQEIEFDLSFFVPLSITTKEIEDALSCVDDLVRHVGLIDFFEKEDWKDKRALAFRVRVVSDEKTLEKDAIENIRQKAIAAVEKTGAILRG